MANLDFFHFLSKKVPKSFGDSKKCITFALAIQQYANRNNKLGYGVMVTLQILVLSFLVRVRVSQQNANKFHNELAFFLFLYFGYNILKFSKRFFLLEILKRRKTEPLPSSIVFTPSSVPPFPGDRNPKREGLTNWRFLLKNNKSALCFIFQFSIFNLQ